MIYHTPVLMSEIIEGLGSLEGKVIVDATYGGGGYAKEMVKRGATVIGIDQDRDAIQHAEEEHIPGISVKYGNFKNIDTIVKEAGYEKVDGVTFDIGVSSHQFDTPERGFSIRFEDAKLDMRMDQTQEWSGRDVVNAWSQQELTEIFMRFGEEEKAEIISYAIVKARKEKVIETVGQLKEIIKHAGKIDIDRAIVRVFQAIRIAVNDELQALKSGLTNAKTILKPEGRILVVTFHSLEDRIVKQWMDKQSEWKVITKKPIIASADEQKRNPRSRSAKLRIGEQL